MPRLAFDSPLGRLTLFEEDGRLAALDWYGKRAAGEPTPLLLEARRQLAAYFDGRRQAFDLPLAPAGSPFELPGWPPMPDLPHCEPPPYCQPPPRPAPPPPAPGHT